MSSINKSQKVDTASKAASVEQASKLSSTSRASTPKATIKTKDSVNISKDASDDNDCRVNLNALSDNFSVNDKDSSGNKAKNGENEESNALASTAQMGEQGESGEPEPIVIKGTNGNDEVKIQQNEDGSVLVNVNGKTQTFSNEEAERLLFDLGKGDDSLIADRVTHALNINAGEGNNTIVGGDGNDRITAGNGKNTIIGGGGNDTITVGNGNNIITGGAGDDTITSGKGNNVISGGEGKNTINSGSDKDIIVGEKPGAVDPKNIPTQGVHADENAVSPELEQYYASRGEQIIYEDHYPFGTIPLVERVDGNGKTVKINANMGPDFDRMVADAAKEGITFAINSAYRTREKQIELGGSHGAVDPGTTYAVHERGMALDIGVDNNDPGRIWFTEHAAEYNFESYFQTYGSTAEPWHFEYTGNQPQTE